MMTTPHLPPVEVDVHHGDDGWLVLPRGDLDVVGAPRLSDALARAERGEGPVTIDLTHVGFVDSAGLRAVLRTRQRLVDAGRHLRLTHVDDRLRRLLEITGLDDRLLA